MKVNFYFGPFDGEETELPLVPYVPYRIGKDVGGDLAFYDTGGSGFACFAGFLRSEPRARP